MKLRSPLLALVLGSTLLSAQPAEAPFGARPEVQAFIRQMVTRHGFEEAPLQARFAELRPDPRIQEAAAPTPPPGGKNWKVYRSRFVEPKHIRAGVAFWKEHGKTLVRAEQEFGVPAEVIVGIIGVETFFGRGMGRYPALPTLATLAFAHPDTPTREARSALFQEQLEAFLLWCRDAKVDPGAVQGSTAGALGIPQFLPSSIREHGVDFDGDGRIDLLGSVPDAIGSVARFLVNHGWERGAPVVWTLPTDARTRQAAAAKADGDPLPKHRLGDLVAAGIRPRQSRAVLKAARERKVILVDLPSPGRPTEYRIGFPNFYAVTRYNRSFFYAASVTELGLRVKAAAKKAATSPRGSGTGAR